MDKGSEYLFWSGLLSGIPKLEPRPRNYDPTDPEDCDELAREKQRTAEVKLEVPTR